MAIDWSHLPKEVIDKVCLCRHGFKNGYTKLPATGWWVDPNCKKPSIMAAVKECDNCEKVFVPKYFEKAQLDFLGILCDECDPPREPA